MIIQANHHLLPLKEVTSMDGPVGTTKVVILYGDISQQDTEAVVNPTNSTLGSDNPVDVTLKRAGGLDFLKECRYHVVRHGGCAVGEAVVTGAGKLAATYVIHAVGPNWTGGQRHEEKLLRQTYWNILLRAEELGVTSLSIPAIGGGTPGVPAGLEAKTALTAVRDFMLKERKIKEIRFVLLSKYDALEYEQVWEKLSYTVREKLLEEYLYA